MLDVEKPKVIEMNDGYIDLRTHGDWTHARNSKHGNEKQGAPSVRFPITKLENRPIDDKELINVGLKRLVTTYNAQNAPNPRPHSRRVVGRQTRDKPQLKCEEKQNKDVAVSVSNSVSDGDVKHSKAVGTVQSKRISTVTCRAESPSTKTIFVSKSRSNERKPEKLDESSKKCLDELQSFVNRESLNHKSQNTEQHGKLSNEKLVEEEKHSPLKIPRKRSHTLPMCSKTTVEMINTRNSKTKKSVVDVEDRNTYLYDDGTDIDSIYLETRDKENFLGGTNSISRQNGVEQYKHCCVTVVTNDDRRHFDMFRQNSIPNLTKVVVVVRKTLNKRVLVFHSQFYAVLFVAGTVCGAMLVSLLAWFLFGNETFAILFPPKRSTPMNVNNFMKFLGGAVIHCTLNVVKMIGRAFAVPTQQVYSSTPDYYSWPSMNGKT